MVQDTHRRPWGGRRSLMRWLTVAGHIAWISVLVCWVMFADSLPRHAAAGHVWRVNVRLSLGQDPDERDDLGRAAIHWAAERGDRELVLLLIDSGADLTVRDSGGRTPLDLARENGHADTVQLLLEHGAKTAAELRGESED